MLRLTQIPIDQFTVVHLSSHGSDLLQPGLLSFHALLQPLQLLGLRLNRRHVSTVFTQLLSAT